MDFTYASVPGMPVRYKYVIAILCGLLLVAILLIVVLIRKVNEPLSYDNLLFKQADTYLAVKQNIERAVELPAEQPQVAQIADIDTLRAQKPEVYSLAANDDVVFTYSTVIVIYRPSTQKIVSVIPMKR